MSAEIKAWLQARRPEMIELIKNLVELESPTADKAACDAVISFVADQCASLTEEGDQIEIVPLTGHGNGLKVSLGRGEEKILLVCHLDTVWPVGTLARRPFTVKDEIATGPGVFDMKTGAAMGIWAVKALKELDRLPDKRIVLLFNTDEEMGTPSSRKFILAEAQKAKAALIMEPSTQGRADLTRKGVGMFWLEVTGKPAHSGGDHAKGINAIAELAHQILKLEAMTDYSTGVTVNVGKIKGGQARNQTASHAEALIDLRFKTPDQGRAAEAAILALEPVIPGARIKIRGGVNRPPLEATPANLALFEKARELAREIGYELEGTDAGGGSDGSFISALGIPTLDGIGAVGEGAHADHEKVDLKPLVERTAMVARLIEEI